MENREIKTDKPQQLLDQDEFVYLTVTLNKIPNTPRTNSHRIRLPHPLINTEVDSPELCLIIDDRAKSGLTKKDAKEKIESENIPITKVLKLSKLKTDYKAFEAKRKLLIRTICSSLTGESFVQKKIPLPVDLKHRNWKQQIEKGCGSAMFFVRTGTCSVVKVGKVSMERDEVVENVMATLNGVVEILPGNWKYVRSLHLKLSESVSLPIYQSVPDLKLKIDAFEEKEKKGKSDDAVKGKKKKGRIHEVKYMDSNVSEVLDEDEIGDVDVKEKRKNKRKKEEVWLMMMMLRNRRRRSL
ncbi:hypothetical protein Bca52824_008249 [Brassica carinata]|uniref:Uncharacterized protein n=1 Tax=Brassica carinata TaxID=52824 RepID=A0A8X7W8R3_BRACI|nr:hypothetical protein Bca52824_008249 [Brassica carinata]